MNHKIMILEDNHLLAENFKDILMSEGYIVKLSLNSTSFFTEYPKFKPDLIILDIRLDSSEYNGLEVLEILKEKNLLNSKVIILSGEANKKNVEQAIKLGAYNFVEKNSSLNIDKFLVDVRQALALKKQEDVNLNLQIQNINLRKQLIRMNPFIGESSKMLEVREKIELLTKADVDILLIGETGTGKEVVADRIYRLSDRFDGPFQTLNCSTIGDDFFNTAYNHQEQNSNHEDQQLSKFFETCDKGILFFDEISNLNLLNQAKILRAIEYKEIHTRKNHAKNIDVRFIFASNENIKELIKVNKFRKDLYYRIEGNVIVLPALRDREEDIVLLMNYFFKEFKKKYDNLIDTDLDTINEELLGYNWPGNIRELKNFCEHISIHEQYVSNKIILKHLQSKIKGQILIQPRDRLAQLLRVNNLAYSVSEYEKQYLRHYLKKNDWKLLRTAKDIGIERTTLYKKMKKYDIQVNKEKNEY